MKVSKRTNRDKWLGRRDKGRQRPRVAGVRKKLDQENKATFWSDWGQKSQFPGPTYGLKKLCKVV